MLPAMTANTRRFWNSKNAVPIKAEEAIEAIQTPRRRFVLQMLEQDSPQTVDRLSKQIAAAECDKSVDNLNAQERKRVYIALVQGHLGKLDKLGAATYIERDKVVRSTPATSPLVALIRHIEEVCEV